MLSSAQRLPRNYALLLEVVREAGRYRHRTALEIFDAARRHNREVGFATVHRGLNRLVELGLIARLQLPGSDAAFYEASVEPHAHFSCRACHAIRDLAFALPEAVRDAIAHEATAYIDVAGTSFAGICHRCRGER